MSETSARRSDVRVESCVNKEADDVFVQHYWMKRIRRSQRLSYTIIYQNEIVAWIQVAEPFGTQLTKSLQTFHINEAVELCRGYFIDDAPKNIESCAIGKMLRRLPNDWFREYKTTKKIGIIFQDINADQKGIVYKALGFKPYGYCVRARHYTLPTRGSSSGKKIVWARGLKPVSGRHYKVQLPDSKLIDFQNNQYYQVNENEPKYEIRPFEMAGN
ncbi:hypothetical protein ACFLV2_01525 [Chloroflexota bacterium]